MSGGKAMDPGVAIVRTWQGVAEIGVRIFAIVLVVITFIAAAIAASKVDNINDEGKDDWQNLIQESDHFSSPIPDTPELISSSRGVSGWTIVVFFLFVVYEALVLLVRFLNITCINLRMKVFLIVDAIASGVFAVLYLSAAIDAAVIASLWDEWVDYGEDYLSESYRDEFNLDFTGIRDSYAVCSAFCFLTILALLFLFIWMVLSIALKWSDAISKQTYTVREDEGRERVVETTEEEPES